MYSSNKFCIKNKKDSTKYMSHHTVSKFHRFFLSKMFMRIHLFFWFLKITEQTGRVRFLPGPRIVSTFSRENEYGFTNHVQYFRDTYGGLYF